jgi:hypothetical protein
MADRADVVSSFTIIKGALIGETYDVFAGWDLDATTDTNLRRLKQTNFIGASSSNWLRDVAKVIHRRYDPEGRDRVLVELAKRGCPRDVFAPILLWHMTRDEFLVRAFLVDWLFAQFADGAFRLRADDVEPFLDELVKAGKVEAAWSMPTKKRVATALLRMGVDFCLLTGTLRKEFASYHLPEPAFLYILHAVHEREHNARRIVNSPEWRMFLMRPDDVERELLRLHQYRRVEYDVAGTLSQLKLPYTSPALYAQEIAA